MMIGRGTKWQHTQWKQIAGNLKRQVLLVPEAPILIALLLIGWVYHFPVVVSFLIMLTLGYFVVRLFLLTTAAQELEQAHYRQADHFSRAALRFYPWSPDALALRAHTQLLQGDDEAAEALLREANRRSPGDVAIASGLATVLLARGDIEGGRAYSMSQQAMAGAPYAAQPLAWLALHADNDPEAAQRIIGDVNFAAANPAQAAPLLVLLGETQLAGQSLFAARETVRRIETLLPRCSRPQQAELWYHLGRLHALLGEDSGSYFRKSINLDPNGRWAHAAWRAAVDQSAAGSRSVGSGQEVVSSGQYISGQ